MRSNCIDWAWSLVFRRVVNCPLVVSYVVFSSDDKLFYDGPAAEKLWGLKHTVLSFVAKLLYVEIVKISQLVRSIVNDVVVAAGIVVISWLTATTTERPALRMR